MIRGLACVSKCTSVGSKDPINSKAIVKYLKFNGNNPDLKVPEGDWFLNILDKLRLLIYTTAEMMFFFCVFD